MRFVAIKNIFLPAVLLAVFIVPLCLSSAVSAAPDRSDCNSTSKPDKCKDDYDKCKNDTCRKEAIDKYKGISGLDCGRAVGGDGSCIAAPTRPHEGGYQCGNLPDDSDNVTTKFNFGCLGTKGPAGMGPIQDMLFALIRFLSVGVGIAVTLALIAAGIQYSSAEGNPESSQKAKLRAQQALIGLAIYIFAFSLLQFLIPGGIFNK